MSAERAAPSGIERWGNDGIVRREVGPAVGLAADHHRRRLRGGVARRAVAGARVRGGRLGIRTHDAHRRHDLDHSGACGRVERAGRRGGHGVDLPALVEGRLPEHGAAQAAVDEFMRRKDEQYGQHIRRIDVDVN